MAVNGEHMLCLMLTIPCLHLITCQECSLLIIYLNPSMHRSIILFICLKIKLKFAMFKDLQNRPPLQINVLAQDSINIFAPMIVQVQNIGKSYSER